MRTGTSLAVTEMRGRFLCVWVCLAKSPISGWIGGDILQRVAENVVNKCVRIFVTFL